MCGAVRAMCLGWIDPSQAGRRPGVAAGANVRPLATWQERATWSQARHRTQLARSRRQHAPICTKPMGNSGSVAPPVPMCHCLRPAPEANRRAAMITSRVCMLTVCIRSPGMHVRMRVRSSGVHACATAGVQWPGRCMLTLRHELLVAASVQRVLPVVGLALIPAAKEKDLFYFLNSENNSWLDFGECETAWGEEGGRMPSPFFGAS